MAIIKLNTNNILIIVLQAQLNATAILNTLKMVRQCELLNVHQSWVPSIVRSALNKLYDLIFGVLYITN